MEDCEHPLLGGFFSDAFLSELLEDLWVVKDVPSEVLQAGRVIQTSRGHQFPKNGGEGIAHVKVVVNVSGPEEGAELWGQRA